MECGRRATRIQMRCWSGRQGNQVRLIEAGISSDSRRGNGRLCSFVWSALMSSDCKRRVSFRYKRTRYPSSLVASVAGHSNMHADLNHIIDLHITYLEVI